MSQIIQSFEQHYMLGIDSMDETHKEFVEMVNLLSTLKGKAFAQQFIALFKHTNAHFSAENELMEKHKFPAIREHIDEHQRILGDLNKLEKKVRSGSTMMAKAYVNEQLPSWFDLHAKTMDSALAAHLKGQDIFKAEHPSVHLHL